MDPNVFTVLDLLQYFSKKPKLAMVCIYSLFHLETFNVDHCRWLWAAVEQKNTILCKNTFANLVLMFFYPLSILLLEFWKFLIRIAHKKLLRTFKYVHTITIRQFILAVWFPLLFLHFSSSIASIQVIYFHDVSRMPIVPHTFDLLRDPVVALCLFWFCNYFVLHRLWCRHNPGSRQAVPPSRLLQGLTMRGWR